MTHRIRSAKPFASVPVVLLVVSLGACSTARVEVPSMTSSPPPLGPVAQSDPPLPLIADDLEDELAAYTQRMDRAPVSMPAPLSVAAVPPPRGTPVEVAPPVVEPSLPAEPREVRYVVPDDVTGGAVSDTTNPVAAALRTVADYRAQGRPAAAVPVLAELLKQAKPKTAGHHRLRAALALLYLESGDLTAFRAQATDL